MCYNVRVWAEVHGKFDSDTTDMVNVKKIERIDRESRRDQEEGLREEWTEGLRKKGTVKTSHLALLSTMPFTVSLRPIYIP